MTSINACHDLIVLGSQNPIFVLLRLFNDQDVRVTQQIFMCLLSRFDLVDFSDDAQADQSLDFIGVDRFPDVFAFLHGSHDVDAQLVMRLDLVVIVDLQHCHHCCQRCLALCVLTVRITTKLARLALLCEEVFDDSVLRVDVIVLFACFASVRGYNVIDARL